jgi:uncharacterized protein (DUF1697 family)
VAAARRSGTRAPAGPAAPRGGPAQVALLRGVNLGGHKLVGMAGLRAWAEDLGLRDVRTLLQSGNLVFRGAAKTGAALEAMLEAAAKRGLGLDTDIHVRTAAELGAIVARNPFPRAARRDPAHLVVVFLKAAPAAAGVAALRAAIPGREEIEADGRQLYVVYPDGIGTSRLNAALLDRTLKVRGTARNWNTVLKLAALVAG